VALKSNLLSLIIYAYGLLLQTSCKKPVKCSRSTEENTRLQVGTIEAESQSMEEEAAVQSSFPLYLRHTTVAPP
jgi:hypothetical protein